MSYDKNEGFKQIASWDDEISEGIYSDPLKIIEKLDSNWEKVEKATREFAHDSFEMNFYEDPSKLMHGTLNLINRILSSQKRSEPIDTLIFLDKSARLAAHIFRVTWDKLQLAGKIPNNYMKPKIKFIEVNYLNDIYRHSENSLNLAKTVFPISELTTSGVLIIDEWVATGSSMMQASKFLQQLYGVRAPAMANFTHLPHWYNRDNLKGVADSDIKKDLFLAISQLTPNEFLTLKSIVEEKINKEIILEKLERIKWSISDRLAVVSAEEIYTFFKSAGGFLTLRSGNKSFFRESLQYRNILTKMVELSIPMIMNTG